MVVVGSAYLEALGLDDPFHYFIFSVSNEMYFVLLLLYSIPSFYSVWSGKGEYEGEIHVKRKTLGEYVSCVSHNS